MINFKLRRKFLKRIAQAALPDITTDQSVKQTPNTGTPPTFQASSRYPSLRIAFNTSGAINIIDNLSSYLNNALFYASNGKYYMQQLFQQGFNYSASDLPTSAKDLKLLLLFTKEIFVQIYNRGAGYTKPLTKEEFTRKISLLLENQNLMDLSQVNPTGQLSIKMGGNIKTDLIKFLTLLLNVSPSQ